VARVFVSHAGEDRVLAGEVHRWLVEAGHEVFLDQDLRDGIALGEEWERRLHERCGGLMRWSVWSSRPTWTRCGVPSRSVSPGRGGVKYCRCAPSRMRLTRC
jgi:hypothetical protein